MGMLSKKSNAAISRVTHFTVCWWLDLPDPDADFFVLDWLMWTVLYTRCRPMEVLFSALLGAEATVADEALVATGAIVEMEPRLPVECLDNAVSSF